MIPQVTEFRRLHESGCFVIPNPWDIGSARLLVNLGFPALATTSAGLAWSVGRRDNEISLEIALAHLRTIAACVGVPVNADFEDGFATEPEGIALFDDQGNATSGEVTEHIGIYDAGTEIDEELAIGPDTGPQQPAPDTGAADPVHLVREVGAARYGVPASSHLRVTLSPQ